MGQFSVKTLAFQGHISAEINRLMAANDPTTSFQGQVPLLRSSHSGGEPTGGRAPIPVIY